MYTARFVLSGDMVPFPPPQLTSWDKTYYTGVYLAVLSQSNLWWRYFCVSFMCIFHTCIWHVCTQPDSFSLMIWFPSHLCNLHPETRRITHGYTSCRVKTIYDEDIFVCHLCVYSHFKWQGVCAQPNSVCVVIWYTSYYIGCNMAVTPIDIKMEILLGELTLSCRVSAAIFIFQK